MRRNYRFIILSTLFLSGGAQALDLFLEGVEWRATEINNWAYVNSLTLPNQGVDYKTITFNYSPGFRVGAIYDFHTWDTLFAYTRYTTTANDAASGSIQPSFVGSVTAKPSTAYLYSSGQVAQNIYYNVFDFNVGEQLQPASAWMLHPYVGLMGGWIDQRINARYQGSTSTNETIDNNFSGVGPKVGANTSISLLNCYDVTPKMIAAMSVSYLLGHWNINDETNVVPARHISVSSSSRQLGALAFQASIGAALDYKQFSLKLSYEFNDWFNQVQFFDNDTGTHNNDLILQGLTLGVVYHLA